MCLHNLFYTTFFGTAVYTMENNNILDYINLSESGLTKSEIQQLYSYDTQQINIEQIEQIKVNVIILVKNQEKLIKKAIDSVLSIADNIYVFDTGSTDGTKKVVASYPEKVHLSEKEWVEDYSYMRNYAMKNITEGEWIFIIDSDESLKTKFSQLEFKIMLYLLDYVANLKNIVLTIRQESQENSIVGYPQRIFKKNSNLNFYGVVHEELRAPIIKNISTEITLHNLGTATEEIKKFDKVKRYNNLLLKNIQNEPLYIKWFALLDYDFGKENLPDYHKRMDFFCKLIQKNKSNITYRDDVFEMTLLAKKIYDNILNQKFDEAKQNI